MAQHPYIHLVEQPPEEEEERTEEPPAGEPVPVWGNLAAFLERLDEEWTSSLKVGAAWLGILQACAC